MSNKFDRFSKSARQVLTFAQDESQQMRHGYIGTEHILLGLLRQTGSVPSSVLHGLGVDLPRTRTLVAEIVGMGQQTPSGPVSLTPRTKHAIELAVDEAHTLSHHTIGPEHLLLGLLREGDGIAVDVLRTLQVNLQTVREQTIQQLPTPTVEPANDNEANITQLIALVNSSANLADDAKSEIVEALHFIAEQFAGVPRNKLIVKGTLQAIQWVVSDADIAVPALNSIAQLLQSLH